MKTTLIVIIILIGVAIAGYFVYHQKAQFSLNETPSLSPSPTPTPEASTTSTPMPEPSFLPITKSIYTATIKTAKGNITIELYADAAPKTVANFITLSQAGFYNNTKFHRVVADFVIQGGDPFSSTDDPRVGRGGPGYQFEDEINPKSIGVSDELIKQYEAAGYKYDYTLKSLPMNVGAFAMANAGPNTNGSQFFIVTTKPQPALNGKHTVFGKVTKGMDVVRKIAQGDVVTSIAIR